MSHKAALALLLLALASGARAGFFQMELVAVSNSEYGIELATCLSSMRVTTSGTDFYINATSAGGNFVKNMWYPAGAPSYDLYKECPNGGATYSGLTAAKLQEAISKHIYGAGKAITINGVAFLKGKVTVTHSTDHTLTYVIVDASGMGATDFGAASGDLIVIADPAAAGLTDGDEWQSVMTANCDSGAYGLIVSDKKLCPLCPAGMTGDGTSGCTTCEPGSSKAVVGAGTCGGCSAGTYAAEGSSTCLPCPQHTSSAANAGECTACAKGSFAWVPGTATCMTCTPNYAVVQVAELPQGTDAGQCSLYGDANVYGVPAYTTCTSWKGATPSLQLSIYTAADCSVTISPITDDSCSEPGNKIATSYVYNNLVMRAYYQTATTIRSLLPVAGADGGSDGFLLSIDGNTASDGKVDLKMWAATSIPANSGNVVATNQLCSSNDLAVGGGKLAGETVSTCAAGTYLNGTDTCPPCPAGSWCASGSKTACDAGSFNQLLGQKAVGACTACTTYASGAYTSYAGAAYCTVTAYDRTCKDQAGVQFDEALLKCVACPAGTVRAANAVNLECQPCSPGQYAKAATTCESCPAGEYAPTAGLVDQNPGDDTKPKCLICPWGSVATTPAQMAATTPTANSIELIASLVTGATTCEACPAGWTGPKVLTARATAKCSACGADTYRSGDAAPENNECKAIPAGYKADLATAATGILLCDKGEVSYYNAQGARVPLGSQTTCQSCVDYAVNTYAPRTGMASCLPCQGGTVPNGDQDGCTACGVNTFRSFYTVDDECATCAEGKEVGPSSRQACTQCRPGTYKDTAMSTIGDAKVTDTCADCPRNMYAADAGATGCLYCERGYTTEDEGNTECTACPVGYYSPKKADQSATSNCVAAPAGSYVNTTAAYAYALCTPGTFSKEEASDNCDPCPAGQYANLAGSKSCKTCQAGTFSSGSASACKSCQAGYYAPAGASVCSPCKPGYYTGTVRSATCALCPKGKQCPAAATATPTACPRGYFSAKEGAKLCTACPVNTIAANTGSVGCTACPAGTSTRGLVGQSACQTIRPNSLRRSML